MLEQEDLVWTSFFPERVHQSAHEKEGKSTCSAYDTVRRDG